MPQEKRRSISYRSFLTCDNPKGVECGAIRKSRTISSDKEEQYSSKVESDQKRHENKNQAPSSAIIKAEKKQMGITGFTRELVDTSPSFQLQVPKGVDNLNLVTNSWSNNGHTEDIARDLLKGVLDLQESLVILSKLQETSSLRRKQKQKQKLEDMRFDDMVGNGLMDSNRCGYLHDEKKLRMGFQGPRVSVDGSSRKSFDGVRSVVRESLLRQNGMKNATFGHFHHRKLDSPNLPSTSSSKLECYDSSISTTASQARNKGKGSNLIVKLMGLDSLPSSPRKFKGREKVLNLTKPVYDIETPRARKPKCDAQELGSKQRAFDEILESLNFKGLLRSNSAKGLTTNSWNFEDPFIHERPPIVVMRPLRVWGDGDPVNEESLLTPRVRRGPPQITVRNSEPSNFRDKFREVTASENSVGKSVYPKKAPYEEEKVYSKLHKKPQKKKEAVRRVCEDEKVTYMRRKWEEEKNTEKYNELGYWDSGNMTRDKMQKNKYEDFFSKIQNTYQERIFSTTLSDFRNVKTSESSNQWKEKRQPVSMVEIQRCKGESKENEATTREEVDSSSENEYVFQTFDSMLIKNLNIERWNVHSTAMISEYDADNQSLSETLKDIEYLKNDQKNSHHIALMDSHEDPGGHFPDDNRSLLSEITSTSISEDYCSVGGHLDEDQSSVSEVTSVTIHETGITVHLDTNEEGKEDVIEGDIDGETSRKCLTPRAKMKAFLLRSPSFVNRAEELFNLQVNPGSIPHLPDESDLDFASPKVLLDCAAEFMELRSSKFSGVSLPPFLTTCPQSTPSLTQLLEEICTGVEYLRCYLNPASEGFSSDHLYVLLDRDLMFKSGMWEVGWRNLHSLDEVEQIVGEVDNFVLGQLIEEVLADFLP